jgi:hypothetical protein
MAELAEYPIGTQLADSARVLSGLVNSADTVCGIGRFARTFPVSPTMVSLCEASRSTTGKPALSTKPRLCAVAGPCANWAVFERTQLSRSKAAIVRRSSAPDPADQLTPEQEIKDPLVPEFLGLRTNIPKTLWKKPLIPRAGTLSPGTWRRVRLHCPPEAVARRRRVAPDRSAVFSPAASLLGHH